MDGLVKQRVMLSLRSEKAFGLQQIVAPQGSDPVVPAAPAPVAEARRQVVAVMRQETVFPISPTPKSHTTALFAGSTMTTPMETLQPFSSPVLPAEKKRVVLEQLDADRVKGCTKCRLSETRTHTVFGEGDAAARLFFIGEGPGENEDETGRPFVGRAGQLLDKMILGMGLKRQQVYIANIVKCRPPGNRVPATDEVSACTPYLMQQLETVRPEVIVTLGRPAAQFMLNTNAAMGALRGRWQEWRGIKLMPTYHPSYVLRVYTSETRAAVWSDLKQVLQALQLPVPQRAV